MPSIHDNLLVGYVVDGTSRTITFHTEPHPGGGDSFIDVVFRGVVAYDFEGDCFENIVSGIYEVPVDRIVGDGSTFAERFRQYGWPPGWDGSVGSASEFLAQAGVTIFELICSYGMYGWVAASSKEFIVIEPDSITP